MGLKALHQKAFLLFIFLLPTQLAVHFWPDFAYVFGIRVDYFAPAIYLTDLLLILVFGLWLLSAKTARPVLSPPLMVAASLFIYLLFSSIFVTQNQGAALYKLARIVLFSSLVFYGLANRQWILKSPFFYRALSLAVIYTSVIAILQFIKQQSLGGPLWFLGERLFLSSSPGIALADVFGRELLRPYGTFSHPNSMAGFILVALVFLAPWREGWSKFAFALGTIALFLSNSWTAYLTALLLIAYHLTIKIKKKARFVFLLLIATLIISGTFLFLLGKPFGIVELQDRIHLGNAARDMFLDSPIFGVGLNNFIARLPEFADTPKISWWLQPVHNMFILWATETGIVGLALLGYLAVRSLPRILLRPDKPAFLLLAIFLTGTADHYWLTLQQNILLFGLVLGLTITEPASR